MQCVCLALLNFMKYSTVHFVSFRHLSELSCDVLYAPHESYYIERTFRIVFLLMFWWFLPSREYRSSASITWQPVWSESILNTYFFATKNKTCCCAVAATPKKTFNRRESSLVEQNTRDFAFVSISFVVRQTFESFAMRARKKNKLNQSEKPVRFDLWIDQRKKNRKIKFKCKLSQSVHFFFQKRNHRDTFIPRPAPFMAWEIDHFLFVG